MAAYRSAIALKPDFAQAHVNLGVALRDLHRFDEALQQFALAIDIDPNYAAARTNRAQTNLLLGHFEPGWREYEWRWLDGGTAHGFDPQKLWTGEQAMSARPFWFIPSRDWATRCSLSAMSICWCRRARG